MAECRRYARWIALHSGGDLDEERADRLRAHVASCEACARALAEYRSDRRRLRRYTSENRPLAGSPAQEEWWPEIRERIGVPEGATFRRSLRRAGRRIPSWSIAALLLAGALLGFGVADRYLRTSGPGGAGDPSIEREPTGVRSFPQWSAPVSFPIRNLSRSPARPGVELDVEPGPAVPSNGDAPQPRRRLLLEPPRTHNY